MVNKKIVIIATIITIIVVTGIVYFSLNRELKKQYTYSESIVENQVESDKDNISNIEEDSENKTETKENEIQEDKTEKEEIEDKEEVEENKDSETEKNEEKDEEKEQIQKPDGKDKAIELAKKEWGQDDNTVYYYVEEQVSDNVYLISVRDQSTTQDLLTYKVNINKNTVEKY